MKSFYSCLDPFVVAPQSEQHTLINKKAAAENGKVVFYGAEDFFAAQSQPFILFKLKRTPNIDGVIFFTINQFCYGSRLNLKLLYQILELKISVHFAREFFSILNSNQLEDKYIELLAYFQSTFKNQNGFLLNESK